MATYSEKLRDPRWQKKRLEILNRDEWTCRYCLDTTIELQVHHKKYNGDPWQANNDDLVTCCKYCHALLSVFKTSIGKDEIIGIIKFKIGDTEEKDFVAKHKNGSMSMWMRFENTWSCQITFGKIGVERLKKFING